MDAPDAILDYRPGSLVVSQENDVARIRIREDPVRFSRYPRQCAVELRLLTWDAPPALLIALLVRVGRSDFTTFQHWVNASDNADLRVLQALAEQARVDIEIVAEGASRQLTTANTARATCRATLELIRHRKTWTAEQFTAGCAAVDRLYPTAHATWWAGAESDDRSGAPRTLDSRGRRGPGATPEWG